MGNSQEQAIPKKLTPTPSICPKCDLIQHNISRKHQELQSEYYQNSSNNKCLGIKKSKIKQPEYYLLCCKTNRNIKYRFYRHIKLTTLNTQPIKINLINKNEAKYNQKLEQYHKRSKICHQNTIKVSGLYNSYRCCHCQYRISDISILTEDMQPLQIINNKKQLLVIVEDWIKGIQYLLKQNRKYFEINKSIFGISTNQIGKIIGKVWPTHKLYQNYTHHYTNISRQDYQKKITTQIAKYLKQTVKYQLNVSGMNLSTIKRYLSSQKLKCGNLNSQYYEPQSINLQKYYEPQSVNLQKHSKISQTNHIKSYSSHNNILSNNSVYTSSSRLNNAGINKIKVLSARKANYQDRINSNQYQNRNNQYSNRNNQYSNRKYQYSNRKYEQNSAVCIKVIHNLSPPKMTNNHNSNCLKKHNQQSYKTYDRLHRIQNNYKTPQKQLAQNLKIEKKHKNTYLQKKQSQLIIVDHKNGTSKMQIPQQNIKFQNPFFNIIQHKNMVNSKTAKKQSVIRRSVQMNSTPTKTNAFMKAANNFDRFSQKTNTINQLSENKSQKNRNIDDSRISKKSIEKADLLKYQSYYDRIITQPLHHTFTTKMNVQEQPHKNIQNSNDKNSQISHESIEIQDQTSIKGYKSSVIQQKKPIQLLDIEFNYTDWKKNQQINNQISQQDPNNIEINQKSFGISQRQDEDEISEVQQKKFVSRDKQYSQLSDGAQQFIKKNKQDVQMVDSYITTFDDIERSNISNNQYIYEQSIIVKGLQTQNNPTLNSNKYQDLKFNQKNMIDKICINGQANINQISSPIKKLKQSQFSKERPEDSDSSTHNIQKSKRFNSITPEGSQY